MSTASACPSLPYYSQWESSERAADILAGHLALAEDPNWAQSGATSPQEYAEWADHICGMACLKMILAARTGKVYPTLELTRMALEFGAYVRKDHAIHGMIYAPFVKMIKARFEIDAEVLVNLTAHDLLPMLRAGSMFMASVHPSIRWLAGSPPRKGGHLVLVSASEERGLVLQNPSGHDSQSQRDVVVPVQVFDAFFAGRGVRIHPVGSGKPLGSSKTVLI